MNTHRPGGITGSHISKLVVEHEIMRQNAREAWTTSGSCAWLLAFVLGPLLLAGCGAEAYEKRLSNTQKLFAHMELVNHNLQGTWSDPATGVSLRAPLQFVVLTNSAKAEPDAAAQNPKGDKAQAIERAQDQPAAKEEDEEEVAEEAPDDRQPDYINLGLPGLRGAFKATVKMIAGKGANAAGDAFLYVLTNNDLAESPDQAKGFEQEFVKALTETLHVSVDPDNDWRNEQFPKGDPANNGFVRPVKYKYVTVTPTEEIAGYTRQFSVYIYEQADIQVIVLFVLPADTDTSENFTKCIPLCLETLAVSATRLVLPLKGGAPAAAGSQSSF